MVKLLFICSRNEWRSLTAEHIYRNDPQYDVRSAGTSPSARKVVNAKDIAWADVIFVMEQKHKEMLQQRFGGALKRTPLLTLDIPDNYRYMDEELVELIKDGVSANLDR